MGARWRVARSRGKQASKAAARRERADDIQAGLETSAWGWHVVRSILGVRRPTPRRGRQLDVLVVGAGPHTANGYIDTSAQKGGVPGFSGCIEHTSAISQLIREANINKTDLTVVWLDLANAYGTVPHQLIDFSLKHHHVPEHIQGIARSYYSDINLRFTTKNFTTSWVQLQKGIVTGCTVSVILFIDAMNLIIKAGDRETRGPKTKSDIRPPPQRGFMDDLTITTESHIQARWILSALEDVVSWARMAFKPRKSRALILRRGKVWQSTA